MIGERTDAPSASVTSSTGTAPAGVPALNFATQSAPSMRSSSKGISAMVSARRAGSARPPGPPKYVSFRCLGAGMAGGGSSCFDGRAGGATVKIQ